MVAKAWRTMYNVQLAAWQLICTTILQSLYSLGRHWRSPFPNREAQLLFVFQYAEYSSQYIVKCLYVAAYNRNTVHNVGEFRALSDSVERHGRCKYNRVRATTRMSRKTRSKMGWAQTSRAVITSD